MSEQPEFDDVGTWLRVRRERTLLTQEGLASLAGVNARTIRDLELGHITRPRAATKRLLLEALARAESALGLLNGSHSGAPRPRELPSDVRGFTGRAEPLATLDRLAERAGQHPLIATISGTAGVGKTALTVHWAHRRQARFPDGQLYINLRGYDADQPLPPADALAALLRSLGLTDADIPPVQAERARRYRSLLADRRALIVLDNAHSADQVRDLLPGTPSCCVLVTSRRSLTGLAVDYGAQPLKLELFPPADAVALLATLVGPRVDAEPRRRRRADPILRIPPAGIAGRRPTGGRSADGRPE